MELLPIADTSFLFASHTNLNNSQRFIGTKKSEKRKQQQQHLNEVSL